MKLLVASIARSTQRKGYLRISHNKAAVSFRYPHERAPTPCTDLLESGCHGTLAWIWMDSKNSFSLPFGWTVKTPFHFTSFLLPQPPPSLIGRVRSSTLLGPGRAHLMHLTGQEHSNSQTCSLQGICQRYAVLSN